MYPLQVLLNPLSMLISVMTMTGVTVHDTNVDKAVTTAIYQAQVSSSNDGPTKIGNDPHTHSERGSLSQAVRDLKTSHPRIQPRNDEKKHLLQKHAVRGHHPFDNYTLPIV